MRVSWALASREKEKRKVLTETKTKSKRLNVTLHNILVLSLNWVAAGRV